MAFFSSVVSERSKSGSISGSGSHDVHAATYAARDAAIVAAIGKGAAVKELALEYRLSPARVGQICWKAGVNMRGRWKGARRLREISYVGTGARI